jgi:folate-binding protein YgfZ
VSAELAAAVRRGAGLFVHADRGLLEVTGADRVRWLNGMVSNDVARLRADAAPRACYALLLTQQGRIVADLHVLARADRFQLETARAAAARLVATLSRFIVADDVTLEDRSDGVARFGVEGPRAQEVLAAALGAPLALAASDGVVAILAGAECAILAYGWSGEAAFQIVAPREAGPAVEAALREAGRGADLVVGDPETLELLRVEAGIPLLSRELDESVLPAEARLERAVSATKGCYTGQEVVARLRTQGQPSHLLVGLRFEDGVPEPRSELRAGDRKAGEVTSVAASPRFGPIGLGFVRRPHDAPGTLLATARGTARVAALPFA